MCTNLSVFQNTDSVTPMKTNQPCLTLTKFASMTCKAMSKYHLPHIPDCSECCESIISGQMCCCSSDFAAYQLVSWKIADQSLVSTSDGWVFDFLNNRSFMVLRKKFRIREPPVLCIWKKKIWIKEPLVPVFPKPQRAARFHGRTSSSLGGSLTFSILWEWWLYIRTRYHACHYANQVGVVSNLALLSWLNNKTRMPVSWISKIPWIIRRQEDMTHESKRVTWCDNWYASVWRSEHLDCKVIEAHS
jgi:hypothetical protein